jgi:hypothetical protein
MKSKLVYCAMIILVFSTCAKETYGPNACFTENVLPIFVSNCSMSGCHNSKDKKAGFDLTSYDGIMKGVKAGHPLLSEVYKVIKGNNPSMPEKPYRKLSAKDVSIIKLWINMGAQNTSDCSSCDSTDFSYNTRVKKIMDTWCVGCHNSASSGGGYDLSTYNGLEVSITNNRLIGSIEHTAGYAAMPQGADKLGTCEINIIKKWIASGYPDN